MSTAPAATIPITEIAKATGPVMDATIKLSGPSHGIPPAPAAISSGENAMVAKNAMSKYLTLNFFIVVLFKN
jgi:hypothetical protein